MEDRWSRYEPDSGRPWDLARAAHLLRRAGFGAGWEQLRLALADGPQRTIGRLCKPGPEANDFEREVEELGAAVALSEDSSPRTSAELWIYRMMRSPYPLLEKTALFWHDHFAISGPAVARAGLVERHVRLLRRHALGRFDTLLGEICRDPAMLIACGARENYRSRPAGTFAATLLAKTVGPGAFTPADVRDVARAFTGTFVLRDEVRRRAEDHDGGAKTILGRTGNFDADGAVSTLLGHSATPRFIVRRLYRWFVSETGEPDDRLLAPLVASFQKDYDIGAVVETMLRSNHFFSESYRRRVKSPLEFALGLAAALETTVPPAELNGQIANLGQDLLDPPTREGWAGGRRWLNRFTIIGRDRLASSILAKANPQALAEKHGRGADAPRFFLELLVQNGIPEEAAQPVLRAAGPREQARLAAALPEFQLA